MFERAADDLFRCWINVPRKNALFQLTTSALMGLLTGSLKELHLPSFFFAKAPKNWPQSSQVEFFSQCNLEWGLAEKASGGCTCFKPRICPFSSSHPRARFCIYCLPSRPWRKLGGETHWDISKISIILRRKGSWWFCLPASVIHQTIVKL